MKKVLYYLRTARRYFHVAAHYPRATLASILTILPESGPFCFTRIIPEDRENIKEELRASGKTTGWATTGRVCRLKLFGATVLSINLENGEESNVFQFYLTRNVDFVKDAFDHFSRTGRDIRLAPNARIFEPGCNSARYLYHIADKYNASICGADIFPPAIKAAEAANYNDQAKFFISDVVNSQFLDCFSDNHFDLVFISSHLAHILHLKAVFPEYLQRLCRIGRIIIFQEKPSLELSEIAQKLGFFVQEDGNVMYGHFEKTL